MIGSEIEAEHAFEVQRVARLLAEQAGKVAEQLAAQRGWLLLELELLRARAEADQVEQVAIEARSAIALVLDMKFVLLPGLVEQRGHAVREDVEKRVGGIVAILHVALQQQLGIRARQYARRPDQAHEGDLHFRQRQAGRRHLAFALEVQVADLAGRERQRQLGTKTQRVFVRPGCQVHAPGTAVVQAEQAHQLKEFESVRLGSGLIDQTRG